MSIDDDKRYNEPEEDDIDDVEIDDDVEEVSSRESSSDTTLKEDIDDAKKKIDKVQKEYKELQKKRLEQLDKNAMDISQNLSKEAGKKGAKEGTKQVGKEAGKALAKEGTEEVGKQVLSEGAKQVGKEVAKEGAKQVGKEVAKEGTKKGVIALAEGAGMTIPYLNLVLIGIEALKAIKKVATKIKSKVTGKSEEELKEEKKKRRKLILIAVFIIAVSLFGELSKLALSETVIMDVEALIKRREKRYGEDFNMTRTDSNGTTENYKPLILFSKDEYEETINKDYDNDICYLTMLKEEYTGDLNNLLLASNIFKEGQDTEENRYKVSAKNAQKYLESEKSNFNKIKWRRYTNKDAYGYKKSAKFSSEEDYAANDKGPVLTREGDLKSDVKLEKVLGSELRVPKLDTYDILPGGTDEEKAMVYINMLAPYMQKWVIPWSILVDTEGDQIFVNKVLNDMYHLAEVYLYQLNQENKITERYYYLEIEQRYTWEVWKYYETTETNYDSVTGESYDETVSHREVYSSDNEHVLNEVTNSREHKPGSEDDGDASDVEEWANLPEASGTTYYYIKNVKLHYDLPDNITVAKENGEPMVKEIKVTREIVPYKYVPKLKYLEDLYTIYTANYEVLPISESNPPDYSNGAGLANVTLDNASKGIGVVVLEENWKENFTTLDSKTEKYKVSYYTEEDYEKIGRRISRIEWKQDWGNVINAAGSSIFDSLISANVGGGGGGGSSLEALLEWILPLAQQLQKESGLLPSLTIAQKIQESSWDWTDSVIETECHNYWGMKAGSNWEGDSMVFNTKEDDGSGNLYGIQDAFRKYDSDEAGFSGRGEWFWSYPRYRNVLLACFDGDWEAAVDDFTTNGYATDIHYAESLKKLIEQNELWQYDNDPAYQFDGVPPEYAKYDPLTGDSLGGGSSGSGAGLASGVEFETDPYYSKFKDNEIYPEKSIADLAKAYRNYANGKGYSYDDLYFAFYQIDKYYPEGYFNNNGENLDGMLDIPEGGFAWPVVITNSNPDTAVINCLYGYTSGYGNNHSGVDISRGNVLYKDGALSKGPKIIAAHDGKVVTATENPTSDSDGYTYVEIKTDDGKYVTQYGHLSEIHVTVGQEVKKGDVIGVMGTTGNSTGVHLHYAMFDTSSGTRVRIDPLDFYNLEPEYGSIDRATITGIPTGYRYVSPKTFAGNIDTSNMEADVVATLQDVMKSWPSDIEAGRVELIQKALSLIGKGCKYSQPNRQPGKANPSYLDCSAYVAWAFTQTGHSDVPVSAYTGTFVTSPVFKQISMSELKPGDIGLNNKGTAGGNTNHVGIYIGKTSSGQPVWAHCTSSGINGPQLKYKTANFTVFYRYKNWENVRWAGSSSSSSSSASSTSSDKSAVKKNVTNFLATIQKYSDQIEADYKARKYWEYSNNTRSKGEKRTYNSFDGAKKGERTTNCARIAFWAYYDIGVTGKKEDIYSNSSGNLNISDYNKKQILRYADIIKVNKTPNQLKSEGNLKRGDICLYAGHTNVYIGNNKWYDAGRGSGQGTTVTFTRNGNTLYRFKTIGPCASNYTTHKVTYIIRLKDQS